MGLFRNQPKDEEIATPQDVLAEVLARRDSEFGELVRLAEELDVRATALMETDARVATAYRDRVSRPWSEALGDAMAAFKRHALLNLPALRQCTRLLEAGEYTLAIETSAPLLRALRDLWQAVETVQHAAPDGVVSVSSNYIATWAHAHGRRIDNPIRRRAIEALEVVLPPVGRTIGQAGKSDALQRVRLEELPEELRFRGNHIWEFGPIKLALDKTEREIATVTN